MSEQNKIQIGGDHYKVGGEEHWDRVFRLGLDYFQGQITKYVERWKDKNGIQDLEKARHFLDKYIEINRIESAADADDPLPGDLVVTFAEEGAEETIRVRRHDVSPTGWVQFLFEGAVGDNFEFKCRKCRRNFIAPDGENPHNYHSCLDDPSEPGRSYVTGE